MCDREEKSQSTQCLLAIGTGLAYRDTWHGSCMVERLGTGLALLNTWHGSCIAEHLARVLHHRASRHSSCMWHDSCIRHDSCVSSRSAHNNDSQLLRCQCFTWNALLPITFNHVRLPIAFWQWLYAPCHHAHLCSTWNAGMHQNSAWRTIAFWQWLCSTWNYRFLTMVIAWRTIAFWQLLYERQKIDTIAFW